MIVATISSSFVSILPKILSRCGTQRKNISSSRCTGGSAELVSDPNNILFSNYTYKYMIYIDGLVGTAGQTVSTNTHKLPLQNLSVVVEDRAL